MKKLSKKLIQSLTADRVILFFAATFLVLFAVAELQTLFHLRFDKLAAVWRLIFLLLICLLFVIGGHLFAKRTENPAVFKRLMCLFFFLYLYFLANVTLLDPSLGRGSAIYGMGDEHRTYYLKWFVNLTPMRSIREVYIEGFLNGRVSIYYTVLNLLGNVCAFMPFALFLPLFFQKQKRWFIFLPTVLVCTLSVEVLQFAFMVGSCDIDDVILNISGAFLAFWFLKIPPINRLVCKLTGMETFASI